MNFVRLVAFPAGVFTMIFPVVAPEGTVAVICVGELTVNAANTPLNFTTVAPLKFVPVIVTVVPTGPDTGEKLEMVGDPEGTVKFVALVPVPELVVTEIGPVVAAAGTVALTSVGETNTKPVPVEPLNFTTAEAVKFVPRIETTVPAGPEVGVKLVIVGDDGEEDPIGSGVCPTAPLMSGTPK